MYEQNWVSGTLIVKRDIDAVAMRDHVVTFLCETVICTSQDSAGDCRESGQRASRQKISDTDQSRYSLPYMRKDKAADSVFLIILRIRSMQA